jgi:Helix-loop-helix DNA-binding domain
MLATVTDDVHTIFLASRSNYQNLIEGTHVPGVSYPTELSTNLTSKRTSHKIAEQGRRNRINVALQEMLSLLPKSSPLISARDGSSSNGDVEAGGDGGLMKGELGGKNSGNSKAATVESAIEYIRALQDETEQKSKVVEERDRECESLKKKLRELEKLLGQKGQTPPSGEKERSSPSSTD